ncbi:hypothetical protein PIB30_000140 [Stylosanthes scabra]|uniref:FBD domain-containing protein n=1 Tax=Stylosanthes scabra TaxID=79078 RepID=A0ABU6R287_9FABA|nr:hypothetical protein [Stylosanthes scabra]
MNTPTSAHEHRPPKRQKVMNEGEDKISNLPECIISSILSLLPTKDALRTCVLSKAWINHWRSITNFDMDDNDLHFNSGKCPSQERFRSFVYRSLMLTKFPRLDSFSLSIHYHHDMSSLNNWIAGALNRLLKKLCVKSKRKLSFSFLTSHSLLTSKNLEELEISMSYYSAKITVPVSHVRLGQLKFLTLHEVKFSCSSKDLELSVPLLQKLETVNCRWFGAKYVTFNAPLLETVDITQHSKSSSLNGNCQIKFLALHLREFCYRDYGYRSLFVIKIDPSSSQNASATLILPPYKKRVSLRVQRSALLLLKRFCRVRYLKFGGPDILSEHVALLPEFGMLSHLELDSVTAEFLLGLLLKTPILNTLIVERLESISDKALLESAGVVPDCLRYTLQVVKFRDFCGDEHELCFAKFVMEKGSVLKKMSFSLSHLFVKSEDIEELKEKLFALRKCLTSTIVEVLKEDYYNFW